MTCNEQKERGETMKYKVTYKGKSYTYNAATATKALEKLSNRKVFGEPLIYKYTLTMYDADTRGAEWAEGRTQDETRIFAERDKTMKNTVINGYGVEVDYKAAVELMADDIRERIHAELAPCTEQEFFAAYCKAHAAEYGEEFECAKRNPEY